MHRTLRPALALLLGAAALLAAPPLPALSQEQPSPHPAREPADAAAVERWLEELSNWGRWGEGDQLGTINLITPEVRTRAAALVRAGVTVSLAHATLTGSGPDNANPYEHELLLHGAGPGPWAVDRLGVIFHGYAHSHLDAVCHMFHRGRMYNGFDRSEVTAEGCGKLAIDALAGGIFTRGVLMDIPRLRDTAWLEPGTPIFPEDLEAWEQEAGVRVGPGDALLIRTGRWARRQAEGPWDVSARSAGLHASAARWLRERGVAVLGSDVASDVFPSGVEGVSHPVHLLVLVALGMPIFDNLDLEALAAEAARHGRWEFLLTAAPLPVPGGTGSPLNPIAVF
ncbi:MAG TPA: cyclase family protein [Thermoanaerobaculia bacterium]|nr:cyclase family protein [Thermoanaerobaculia bacterium]